MDRADKKSKQSNLDSPVSHASQLSIAGAYRDFLISSLSGRGQYRSKGKEYTMYGKTYF